MSKKKLDTATDERTDFAHSDIVLKSKDVKKVLLVEDDEQLFGTYSAALLDHGFEIIGATNGSEAVSKFIEKRPDIVVLDYNLLSPTLGGLETASEIMEMKPSAELIILQKRTAGSQGEKVEALGPELILHQPFATVRLISSVVGVANLRQTMALGPR